MKNNLNEYLDSFTLCELEGYEKKEREKLENQLDELIESGNIYHLLAYIEATGREISDALNRYEKSLYIDNNMYVLEELDVKYNDVHDTSYGYIVVEEEDF